MSCGCDDGKPAVPGTWQENFATNPKDSQGLALVAPPTRDYAAARPVRPDVDARRVLDITPGSTLASVSGVPQLWDINSNVSSLAFGGAVPWCVRAFVAPNNALTSLTTAQLRQLAAYLMGASVGGFAPPPGLPLDAYWIMSPGEILDFGVPIYGGVEGFFFASWAGVYPDGFNVATNLLNTYRLPTIQAQSLGAGAVLQGGANYADGTVVGQSTYVGAYWTGNVDANSPTYGPVFAPVLRYGTNPATRILTMPVHSTPWVIPGVPVQANTPGPWICLPAGSRFVTLTFSKNTGTLANGVLRGAPTQIITGTAPWPVDTRIAWLGYDGIRHEHPQDQCTATARGQIGEGHTIEVFECPRAAVGVCAYYTTGTSQGYAVTAAVSP